MAQPTALEGCDEQTYTCKANTGEKPLTFDEIRRVADEIAALLPPCPFRQLMERESKSPDDGYILIVPAKLVIGAFVLPAALPNYVKLSAIAPDFFIVDTCALAIGVDIQHRSTGRDSRNYQQGYENG